LLDAPTAEGLGGVLFGCWDECASVLIGGAAVLEGCGDRRGHVMEGRIESRRSMIELSF
jgi:hypothetical protein